MQQPLRGRIRERHPAVEVQHHDAAGRAAEDEREEVLLLLQLHPFAPQRVDHAVVDLNQPIDVGLPDLADARHEVAVLEQLGAFAHEVERAEETADEREAGQQRNRENGLDGDQEDPALDHHEVGDTRHQQVHDDKVGQEPGAKAHTGISYFSKRR